jgi:hypothetical protein
LRHAKSPSSVSRRNATTEERAEPNVTFLMSQMNHGLSEIKDGDRVAEALPDGEGQWRASRETKRLAAIELQGSHRQEREIVEARRMLIAELEQRRRKRPNSRT